MTSVSNTTRTNNVSALSNTSSTHNPNAILSRYQPTGASAATARQDGLTAGVAASNRMAMNDLPKLQKYKADFEAVAAKHGLPPALLAAIASRESRGGSALDRTGHGDNGNGFGLMQVDHRYHRAQGGPYSREHIDQAAGILKGMLNQVKAKHPDWSPEQQLRGAVAAYNSGAKNVQTIAGMDRGTTGNDYSNDVWARAQALAPHFGGAGGTTGPGNTGGTQAVKFPPFDGKFTTAPSLADVAGNKEKLRIGHQGESVGKVQDMLIAQGYLTKEAVGNDRGFFGPKTREAVWKYQQDKGLKPKAGEEGMVGPQTLGYLQNGGKAPAPAQPGDGFETKPPTSGPLADVASGKTVLKRGMENSPAVSAMQDLLIKHGFMSKEQKATGPGTFGPQTEAAVKAFQAAKGIQQTGQVGKQTLEALQQAPAANPPPSNGGTGNVGMNDVPLYRQGDPRWGSRTLGTSSSLAAAGCAMTATAMAISKISGRPIDPGQLDQYLDRNGGYSGNGLIWGKAAEARGLKAEWSNWSLGTIDQNLAQGRPVVVGVDYKAGSNGGGNGTDHWVTITGKRTEGGRTIYTANDPANGQRFEFVQDGNRLRANTSSGAWRNYVTTGELRTFHP